MTGHCGLIGIHLLIDQIIKYQWQYNGPGERFQKIIYYKPVLKYNLVK